eukprot:1842742-Pleurochrysis_carterae.AAC.1
MQRPGYEATVAAENMLEHQRRASSLLRPLDDKPLDESVAEAPPQTVGDAAASTHAEYPPRPTTTYQIPPNLTKAWQLA